MLDDKVPVLDVIDLQTVFETRGGAVHAVNSVSFHLMPGELLALWAKVDLENRSR